MQNNQQFNGKKENQNWFTLLPMLQKKPKENITY